MRHRNERVNNVVQIALLEKMILRLKRDGTVSQVTIKEGDNVEKKDVMVVLAPVGE